MTFFGIIFLSNIVPISIMIAIGLTLHRVFQLDIRTLSKLNFYCFSPAIVFLMLYRSNISVALLGQVLLYLLLFLSAMLLLSWIVVKLRKFPPSMASAMHNSVIYYNSANYAIPLNGLVFRGDPLTLAVQVLVLMVQNVLPNTLGVYMVNRHKTSGREIIRTVLTFPAVYAIPLAFLLRGLGVEVPEPLMTPIQYVANGFIAIALLTLGVQLGGISWKISNLNVIYSVTLRLLVAPVVAAGIVLLLGYEGDVARALVLSSAVPSSLSSVLLAIEFDNEPEFASQAVLLSTLSSTFTVTLVIFMLQFIP